jgi:hypothetical protein
MKELSPNDLICTVQDSFGQVSDPRRSNSSISLVDSLMSAFAMFSLKYPSMLQLEQRSYTESSNIMEVYGLGRIPSDTQMRAILDRIPSNTLTDAFSDLLHRLPDLSERYSFKMGKGNGAPCYHIVSVDGVEFFSSTSVCCPGCIEKRQSNGTTSHHHQMLCAVLVHPDKQTVLPIASEPISCRDGQEKNDCELNAAKRLLDDFPALPSAESCLFVEDALYANGPHLRKILGRGSHFICRIKPDGNPSLFRILDGYARVKTYTVKQERHTFQFHFLNNVPLNATHPDIRVNLMQVCQTDRRTGKKTTFAWASDLVIKKSNLMAFMQAGRSRWKIENETFNTLKNQGYAFGHSYGHGKEFLANTLATIMLLSFLTDQIQQEASTVFQVVLAAVGSRIRLWEQMRGALFYMKCQNYKHVLLIIAQNHRIRLE